MGERIWVCSFFKKITGLGHLSEICFHDSGGLEEVIRVTRCGIFSLKQEIKCKNLWQKLLLILNYCFSLEQKGFFLPMELHKNFKG